MPDSRRVKDRIATWIEEALDSHGQGEEIVWEISVAPAPDGNPIVLVCLWLGSGLVGIAMPTVITVGNPLTLDQATLGNAIGNSLEGSRQRRTALLAQQEQQAKAQADAQAQANGHSPTPPSGLVLPSGLPPV